MAPMPPTLLEDYQERLADPGTEAAPNDIRDEMPYLLATAEKYTAVRVLELGVRTGRSTSAFLAAAARVGGHVWSVDVDRPRVPAWWHECGYWTFWQGDDMDLVPETEGWPESYHVLLVDTSHERHRTLAEARKFVPMVAAGGVALFHDTKLEGVEVALALDDFCREYSQLARASSLGVAVAPVRVTWKERGGKYGLGVIERPNG